jgi:hypothetical protein
VIASRERFARELRAQAEYDLGCVVVEGSLEDVRRAATALGHPSSVFGAALSIIVDHGVAVFFCGEPADRVPLRPRAASAATT